MPLCHGCMYKFAFVSKFTDFESLNIRVYNLTAILKGKQTFITLVQIFCELNVFYVKLATRRTITGNVRFDFTNYYKRSLELLREICQICQISFSSDSMPFSRNFSDLKKTGDQWTDGRTDGRMDRRTDGRTDGQTLLQRCVDASKNVKEEEEKEKEEKEEDKEEEEE